MGEFYKTKRDLALYRTCWDIYPRILDKLNVKEDEKILDAGCGVGELGKHIKNKNLYGFDFDDRAVKEAQKRGYKQVIKSDIFSLPFKDKEFDKTFCIEVIEYLSNPKKAFKELLRVTKGEIIISSANFNWYKIKSFFSKRWRKQYEEQIKINKNFINSKFFKTLARENKIKLKIIYISNKSGFIRNLFGNFFAGEVVGIFELHKL
jgi:ubiquinone/menaquinone biosynthesis C-methylase UbiE